MEGKSGDNFEGDHEQERVPDDTSSLPVPEAAGKKEISAEILAASHTIYDLARSYESQGLSKPEEEGRFIQELGLLGLPHEELLAAIDIAFERARSEAESAHAMTMDPFLEEENMVQEADAMLENQMDKNYTNAGVMLLLLGAQVGIEEIRHKEEMIRHDEEMREIRKRIDEAMKEPPAASGDPSGETEQ